MVRRIERDVISQVDISRDTIYKEKINSKKRKFADAFPDTLNNSKESSSSSEGNQGTQTRKKRLLNEMRTLSENVLEYEESIQYLREVKPDFKELQVHEELTQELAQKPLSWLSRKARDDDLTSSKRRIDFSAEEKKDSCELPLAKQSQEKEQLDQTFAFNAPANVSQRLDIIGETSQELGSSMANQSSFQSKMIVHES